MGQKTYLEGSRHPSCAETEISHVQHFVSCTGHTQRANGTRHQVKCQY
jgi:hypothetical protein